MDLESSGMFDNIGRKIKGLAKLICYAGIIVSLYFGCSMIADKRTEYGIIVIVIGAILAWVGSFTLYGFGELVENSAIIAGKTTIDEEKHTSQPRADGKWMCRRCYKLNPEDSPTCVKCGWPRNGENSMGSHRSDDNGKSYWGDSKWRSGKNQDDNDEQ